MFYNNVIDRGHMIEIVNDGKILAHCTDVKYVIRAVLITRQTKPTCDGCFTGVVASGWNRRGVASGGQRARPHAWTWPLPSTGGPKPATEENEIMD